jgi:hypothetical protein
MNIQQKIINKFNERNSAKQLVDSFIDYTLRDILLELSNSAGAQPTNSDLPITFNSLTPLEYGLVAAPLTTPLTFDMTNAIDGGKVIVWHSSATDPLDPYPSIPGTTIIKFGSESFAANSTMKYVMEYDEDSSTIIIVSSKRVNSPPTLTNISVSNSTPPEEALSMTLSYTYAQAEGISENTSAAIVEWYEADTAAELDEAAIVAGTPTLVSSIVGSFGYTPVTVGKRLRGRVKVYTTDSSASGSIWYYTDILDAVIPSAAFNPLSNTSTLAWYDFSQADGGATNTDPNQWETVYNKADISGETDYIQIAAANQAVITNQASINATEFGGNDRYQSSSWTRVADLLASGTQRTMYLLFRMPPSVVNDRIMYFAGGTLNADTTTGFIRYVSSSFQTEAFQANTWTVLKLEYDGADGTIEIIHGAGGGSNLATAVGGGGLDGTINNSTNSFDLFMNGAASDVRHLVLSDSDINTGTQRADLETWLSTQALL